MLKQIGKYTISEELGRGALSRVYRAFGPGGEPLAIKLSTTGADPEHLRDFQQDLITAASVQHKNLASFFDLGFEDGFPYIVMELVEGRDLERILRARTHIRLPDKIRAMLQVGEALQNAHERGVLHLDIRPSKIMMASDGSAKLLDLGLARLSFDPARVTSNGYLIGSPLYMSPERFDSIETTDALCDIWSYGVTFYEWVAEQHPFYDDDGDRMVSNIMQEEPAELENVPQALNEVLARALQKDRARRYPRIRELLADAREVLDEIQREQSDALLARALKQTEGGRWQDARKTARLIREVAPEVAGASQLFGFSTPPPSGPEIPSTPAGAATAVAPPPFEPAFSRDVVSAGSNTVAAPVVEESTPPAAPAAARTNGKATGTNDVATPATPPPPAPRPAPPDLQLTSVPRVRILDAPPPKRFGLLSRAGILAATALAGFLVFWWSMKPGRIVQALPFTSTDAKTISQGARIITATGAKQEPPAAQPSIPAEVSATIVPGKPDSQEVEQTPPAPRTLDPRLLAAVKPSNNNKKSGMALASLKPPAPGLAGVSSELGDVLPQTLPGAPPPPEPVQKQEAAPAAPLQQSLSQTQIKLEAPRPARVGGTYIQPALIHSVTPVYPHLAIERKVRGTVQFRATIAKDGSVQNLQLVSGDPQLNTAARQAVLQWKYKPASLDGEPIEVTQGIVVRFNLSQ